MSYTHSVRKLLYSLQLNGTSTFLPPANEVSGKVMFLHTRLSFCSQGGGGVCLSVRGYTPLDTPLFRQSLKGAETYWLAWYYVEVVALQHQLHLCLYFGIRSASVPVQLLVPLKFCLIKPLIFWTITKMIFKITFWEHWRNICNLQRFFTKTGPKIVPIASRYSLQRTFQQCHQRFWHKAISTRN